MASAAVAVPVRVVSSRNASRRGCAENPGGLDLVRGSFVGIFFTFHFISFRVRRPTTRRREPRTDEYVFLNAIDDDVDARERRCRGYRNADDE
jgi:hypothetical protein